MLRLENIPSSILLNTIRDPLAVVDLKSNFIDFNDSYLEMLGYGRDELLGTSCVELSHKDDIEKSKKIIAEALEKGFVKEYQKRCITKKGNYIFASMTISLMPDRQYFLISTRNVTEQKQYELEMRTLAEDETQKRILNEKALIKQSKQAMMGEMISNIAHQWRQPLNALAVKVQEIPLVLTLGELDDTYAYEFKNESMRLIQFMSQTIDDFRSFFKPENEKRAFDILHAINKVTNLARSAIKDNFIELIIKPSPVKLEAFGLENEFAQVVLNIVNNAKDALVENTSDNREIIIEINQKNQNTSMITITDNAGGIPEHIIDKIFEKYYTTKENSKGTGLGLYMSKIIIEQHMNGNLRAENSTNGAIFTIEIPSV